MWSVDPGTEDDHRHHNQQTYDRIAPRYLSRQLEYEAAGEEPFGALEQRWMAALPAGARVCDLACGPARDGARFAAAGYSVVGMDRSRGMLAGVPGSLRGRLVQADMRDLPFPRAAFDGVWCAAALLHVPEGETTRVLVGIRAVLRRGGVLALVTALGEGSRFEAVPYAPEETRWFVYRLQPRLEEQIESCGFAIGCSERIPLSRHWLTTLARAV